MRAAVPRQLQHELRIVSDMVLRRQPTIFPGHRERGHEHEEGE
ncbi:MAG: hypothetical protein ACI9DF_001853 [Verrucomicrobiales bacterium]|jgi:hypothetical protein